MKKFLSINVNCTNSLEVTKGKSTIRQIFFDGSAEGEEFNGNILPGGIDTQKYIEGKAGSLSARYILEGTDKAGKPCRIFIENNAVDGEEYTKPVLFTDSEVLEYINRSEFAGKIKTDGGKLVIEIYMKQPEK